LISWSHYSPRASLDVGFSFPELVWKQGKHFFIVDGHQRVRAIQQMLKEGYSLKGGALPVSFTEARNKKEAAKKIAMGTSQYGEYDEESMYEFMHLAGLELSELKEWGSLPQLHMGKLEVGYFKDLADPKDDEVPEPPKKAITKLGDLWELGDHRLLCGDCTEGKAVEILMDGEKAALMNTDPPYGIDYGDIANSRLRAADVRKGGAGKDYDSKPYEEITNDDLDGEALQAFLENSIRVVLPYLIECPAFYLWHPMLTQGTFFAAAAAADILIHRQIIWVKPSLIMGRGDYHWRHELCFYGWIRGRRCAWYAGRDQDTIWAVDRELDGVHPTQKPIELFVRPMLNNTQEGDICYEPFSGSGSQFIAAEKLNRRCYGIEIEPRYVDVAVERWEQFTGGKAKRVKAK
jgi:DNA modification methylase